MAVKRCPYCGYKLKPKNVQRNAKIKKLREKGYTYQHLATKFGLVGERIRQIVEGIYKESK